jgi:hypothetical protein
VADSKIKAAEARSEAGQKRRRAKHELQMQNRMMIEPTFRVNGKDVNACNVAGKGSVSIPSAVERVCDY